MARVLLDNPAPAGGALVTMATDLPQAQMPGPTVTIPAGKTDAAMTPITTGPVPPNGIIGVLRAASALAGTELARNSPESSMARA